MKEELVSFQTAKLAKEKGFNIPTRNFYADESWKDVQVYNCSSVGYTEFTNDMENEHGFGDITLIPTQSLLQKWLREAHEIFVSVDVNFNTKIYYKDELHNEIFNFNSYEEALEKGLQEGLKLIEYENKTNTN